MQDLAKKYLKLLKSEQAELRPFTLAVLLVIARTQRFEEPVLEFVKSALVESLRDAHQRSKSRWLEEVYEQRRGPCEAHLMHVVNACKGGWEEVLKPLVMLGVSLTDLTSSKSGAHTDFVLCAADSAADLTYAVAQANDLGISVLLRLFQQTDDVRAEILDQLFSRIISKTESAPACTPPACSPCANT